MATKDSQELKSDERYPLGDYSFRIERTSVPGSTNDKIEAICTDKDGKNARKSIQIPSSAQLVGWYVEANETEATVYATIKKGGISDVNLPLNTSTISNGDVVTNPSTSRGYEWVIKGGSIIAASDGYQFIVARSEAHVSNYDAVLKPQEGSGYYTRFNVSTPYTYDGQTVYYNSFSGSGRSSYWQYNITADSAQFGSIAKTAWAMVYGDPSADTEDKLVGRFAIDIKDAGGVGPGSDWTDPGDYDEDWEEGDPTHTLYVTATGALSGRHNDPIEDPSYSYIPADKDTVKDYGCGGDGGHGGGGGAGASTVVVHKFATNQANSKEVIAIARRHGYGSGGGKGGKGGDGCILVYY